MKREDGTAASIQSRFIRTHLLVVISLDLGCCSPETGHPKEMPVLRVWAEVVGPNPVSRIPLADLPGLTPCEPPPIITTLQNYS